MKDEEPAPTKRFTSYSVGFQKRMLRVLYQHPDFTCTTGVHLSHDHFETPTYRWLAQKMLTYARKHAAGVSRDALKIELERDVRIGRFRKEHRERATALIDGIDAPVKDASFIKEELFRFIKNQTTTQAIRNIVMGGLLDEQDFDGIDAELRKVTEVQESLSGGLGHFFVRDRKDRMRRRGEYVKNGVATGLRVDDHLKPGGVPPASITTIVAPSGIGKSNSLVHVCKSAVVDSGAHALYVTTELSEEMVCDRFDAAFSTIPMSTLEKDRKVVSRSVRDLGAKYGEFLVVKEFPPATMTASALRSYVRQLESVSFYPGIVVVDSADDFVPEVRGKERDGYEDYGDIWRGLRRMSYEINAPVVTASQTHRDALGKEFVDWNKTADSMKKIAVSDLVLILLQTLEEKKHKKARFFVAKNRFGADKWEWPVRLDWTRATIRNI